MSPAARAAASEAARTITARTRLPRDAVRYLVRHPKRCAPTEKEFAAMTGVSPHVVHILWAEL